MVERFDIVIVGGGPAGATAGALLARRSLRVVVCEGKIFPREKVCGEFMGVRMQGVMERLGLLTELEERAGAELRFVAACVPGEAEALVGRMPMDGAGRFPRAMGRGDLDAMLLRRAGEWGAVVREGCHVISVAGNLAEGFLVETSTGSIEARAVVLAHGLAQLGDLSRAGGGTVLRRAYVNFKAHFVECDLPTGMIAIAGAEGIYAGLTGTNRGRFSLAFVVRRDAVERERWRMGNPAEKYLAALRAENPAWDRMLRGARRVSEWMASGPLEPGVRTLYQDGRFFVGNAAGEVHALVGEGITLAMCGAEILAEAVGRFGLGRLAEAGAFYEAAWRREFAGRYRAAQVFANLMMRPGLAGMAGRVVGAWPGLLEVCLRQSGK